MDSCGPRRALMMGRELSIICFSEILTYIHVAEFSTVNSGGLGLGFGFRGC